jgi:hypothetical protein
VWQMNLERSFLFSTDWHPSPEDPCPLSTLAIHVHPTMHLFIFVQSSRVNRRSMATVDAVAIRGTGNCDVSYLRPHSSDQHHSGTAQNCVSNILMDVNNDEGSAWSVHRKG